MESSKDNNNERVFECLGLTIVEEHWMKDRQSLHGILERSLE